MRILAVTSFLLSGLYFSPAHADLDAFLVELKADLANAGRSVEIFEQALAGRKIPIRDVTEKRTNQPEFKFNFDKYHARLVSDWRVRKGIENYQAHVADLKSAESKYDVPAQVITALWGIESSYGAYKGDFDIIPALTALAYQSNRPEFFRKELFAGIKILEEGHISIDKFKGSWAGAMGQCQFIPSSFLSYAADGNGDGRKDIWHTEADVFASAANYLKQRGWQPGEPWHQRVILTEILPKVKLSQRGLSGIKPVGYWQSIGVVPARAGWPAGIEEARLFLPYGPSGKAYVVYNNFSTILRWNNSSSFAFAVLTLADKIAAGVK